MPNRISVCIVTAALTPLLFGCASPFDVPNQSRSSLRPMTIPTGATATDSIYRPDDSDHAKTFELDSSPESFVRYALFQSPDVERAYQQWRSVSQRLAQVAALPDPRLNVGFFLNEVETRVGPQQAKVGISQTFPWIGKLKDREDAAARGALAAWYQYQETQQSVIERVLSAMHDLVYLNEAIQITKDNQSLLKSFDEVVRAKYRVGTGSHPQLIRVQLELAQLDDRLQQLESLRPVYIATLNSLLNRHPQAPIPTDLTMPQWVAADNAEQLAVLAGEHNPKLQVINQRIEQARLQTDIARKDGYPDITIGIDYIVTDEAASSTIAESGDDPILLSFGINLPIWREKYDAAVTESIANRLAISRQLDAQLNTLSAQIYRAWFEHTDADRRVRLYEQSLIPKAQESLAASLGAFRTGESDFLDLLDTQRLLLEFSISAQRARADRGKALALLNRLVGQPIATREESTSNEVQP